ncbi:MAG: hypothetical protein O3A55_00570 [Bacteroidetes bacterium]|nr:hypothetical protein [Bacteroidota bacterium]
MIEKNNKNLTDRNYKINFQECISKNCSGKLIELSYYERNNWVTVEVECKKCKKQFTIKIEY